MSWTRRVKHPSKMVSVDDVVDAVVLDVDVAQNRISLGMKQLEPNPYEQLTEKYPPGTVVEGVVTLNGVELDFHGEAGGVLRLGRLQGDAGDPARHGCVRQGPDLHLHRHPLLQTAHIDLIHRSSEDQPRHVCHRHQNRALLVRAERDYRVTGLDPARAPLALDRGNTPGRGPVGEVVTLARFASLRRGHGGRASATLDAVPVSACRPSSLLLAAANVRGGRNRQRFDVGRVRSGRHSSVVR